MTFDYYLDSILITINLHYSFRIGTSCGINVDFYLLGHIIPSLLACIAALGESYPVERNQFPWHPRTVPPPLVGGSHCVLRSGANAYRCLVRRIVIPGPVSCSFLEFLKHFVGKCRHDLKSRRAPWSVIAIEFWNVLQHCINYLNSPLTDID